MAQKKSLENKPLHTELAQSSFDVLIGGKLLSQNPGLQIAVEELMLSLPPETKDYLHLSTEEDFVDFCETHTVSKTLELFYRKIKAEVVSKVLKDLSTIKKSVSKSTVKSQVTKRPNPALLDIDKSIISHQLGLADWFQLEKVELKQKLIIYIDNSSSISFSRRVDMARSIAILLMSYKKLPSLRIFFFAETVKELIWNKESIEDFLHKYLSIKSSGYTDLSKALRHLQALYNKGHREITLFISDGVSSVGSKTLDLNFPSGKIHYLKLTGKSTVTSEELSKIIHLNKGKTVLIKSQTSLVKPLYQVIKRL
ncbi:MAG: vWA domain-containing protein [Bacteriovoracaceae bacterium]